ncbi:MAG TPA: hypothetical protein ENK56_02915 [Chloroflexi bacterium]|nr:hypothetical protein [Chloroflexota bacterium]
MAKARRPTAMEFGSMPLDPKYAWGRVYEPVEEMLNQLSRLLEEIAKEVYYGKEFTDPELEDRILSRLDELVEQGVLERMPDEEGAMWKRVLGRRKYLRAQRVRIKRMVEYWRDHGGPDI